MYRDALGREIEVGDVVVHFHVANHRMESNPAVVRELKENGNISIDRLSMERKYTVGFGYHWEEPKILVSRRSTIKVPEYCVITELTEVDIKALLEEKQDGTNSE